MLRRDASSVYYLTQLRQARLGASLPCYSFRFPHCVVWEHHICVRPVSVVSLRRLRSSPGVHAYNNELEGWKFGSGEGYNGKSKQKLRQNKNPLENRTSDSSLDLAVSLLIALQDVQLDTSVDWGTIVQRAIETDNKPSTIAATILEEMKKQNVHIDLPTCNKLLHKCIDQGLTKMALALFIEMKKVDVEVNVDTINTLIRAYITDGNLSKAMSILDGMEQAGITPNSTSFNLVLQAPLSIQDSDGAYAFYKEINKDYIDTLTYEILIGDCEKGSLIDRAFELWNDMKALELRPNSNIFNSLLRVCGKVGRTDDIFPLLKEMRTSKVEMTVDTFNTLIQCFMDANKLENAYAILEDMIGRELADETTYETMIKACLNKGEIDGAIELLQVMQEANLSPDLKLIMMLINKLIDQKRLESAIAMLDELKAWKIFPDVTLYNVVIAGCLKERELDKAHTVFKQMQEEGIQPDTETFKIFAKDFIREGQMDEALGLLDDIRSSGGQGAHVWLLKAVVDGYVQTGMFDAALNLLSEYQADFIPDRMLFNTLVQGTIKANKPEIALSLLELMKKYGVYPHSRIYQGAITSCLESFLRDKMTGKLLKALSLLDEMKKDGFTIPLSIYNHMIDVCMAHGEKRFFEKAFSLLDRMQAEGLSPDDITFSTLIHGCERHGKPEQAFSLFEEMKKRGIGPTEVTYTILIRWCMKTGDLKKVQSFLQEMQERNLPWDAFLLTCLIEGYAKNKRFDLVDALWDRIKEEGKERTVAVYNAMIGACWLGKQAKRGLQLVEEMKSEGLQPDHITAEILGYGYSTLEEDKAIPFLVELKEEGMSLSEDVYNAFLDGCVKIGQALLLVDYLQEEGIPIGLPSMIRLINKCIKKNKVKEAVNLFGRIENKDGCADILPFDSLILACMKEKQWDKGLALLDEMKRYNVPIKESVYNVVIKNAAKAQKMEKALSLLEEMKSKGLNKPNPDTFTALINECFWVGSTEQALSLFEELKTAAKDTPIPPIAYQTVIAGCLRAKMIDKALSVYKEMKQEQGTTPVPLFLLKALIASCRAANKEAEVTALRKDMKQYGYQ